MSTAVFGFFRSSQRLRRVLYRRGLSVSQLQRERESFYLSHVLSTCHPLGPYWQTSHLGQTSMSFKDNHLTHFCPLLTMGHYVCAWVGHEHSSSFYMLAHQVTCQNLLHSVLAFDTASDPFAPMSLLHASLFAPNQDLTNNFN